MLLKLESIQNKQIRRFFEHSIYIAIILILIPAFLYFELCVVLPAVEEQWSLAFFIHIFSASFLLMNIMGNMIYGMFTNTTIKGRNLEGYNKDNWTLCTVCECLRPPRSWHCNTCDICVLKRDHHCTFFACCVGYYNQRYFMWFTFYIFVAMVYALYFNIKFLSMFITWNHGLVLIKFIFPLASFVLDFNDESIYVFLVVLNVIVGIFTGFLFFYHLNNILKGRVVPEASTYTKDFVHNKGWKLNLIEVFGLRWYLTWASPFIYSKLPGNGIEWPNEDKCK
ncbi:putative palmitoyltransferase ZDHHC24 [Anticarsia gemmatalis]|uniref:putative palmitoyltransferase ZDHHC24 n=1 Tax=Anticarsia gemmatalis TaxID=129554 RepID=UPI003F77509B